jgi:nucleotide-binding universal stress UspA family protein
MTMLKRILVPLDGSTLAEQALPLAARVARATGGSVLLMRVVNTLQEFGMYAGEASPYLQEMVDEALMQATVYLTQVATSKSLNGINTRIAVFSGAVAAHILDVARDEQIDLLIMSSHGYNGFKRWALGSTAQKVIRHSPVPVLLLRKQGHKLSGLSQKLPHPVRALVALDGSLFAEAAAQPAAELVAALSAPGRGEIHLMQLVRLPTVEEEMMCERVGLDVDIRQAALRQCGEYLQAVRERLCREMGDADADITWSVEECSDVAEALISLTERGEGIALHQPSDLLVMATHGRGGLQRWLMGSVTERALEHSSLPVLIVRPGEQGAKELKALHEETVQEVGRD